MKAVLWIAAAVALTSLGCRPKIGDDCDTNADCSQVGDTLCDRTQPNGYCTEFNCEPGTCPDEAVCIGFSSVISRTPGDEDRTTWACADPQANARFQRNFCMRSCDSNDDCRYGYRCRDLEAKGNEYGAVLVETSRRKNGKVCVVPTNDVGQSIAEVGIPGICTGNLAETAGGAPTLAPPTGGMSGGGGMGGAAGSMGG
ncbi:MAG: hypothetical protein JW751_06770 [Polyangiaceae bacterium]|nr:hypothetical protein [Polyangiaceae bacterium]